MIRPYKMYGDFYVPGCPNAFPTEEEAWEYIEENYQHKRHRLVTQPCKSSTPYMNCNTKTEGSVQQK